MMIILGRRGEAGKWIMRRDKKGQYLVVWWKNNCIMNMPQVIAK